VADTVLPELIDALLEGFHCTVFAYGQVIHCGDSDGSDGGDGYGKLSLLPRIVQCHYGLTNTSIKPMAAHYTYC